MRKLKVFEANICGRGTAAAGQRLVLLSFLPGHCSAPSTPPTPHNSFPTTPSPFSPHQSLLLFPPPSLPIPSSAQTPLNFCSPNPSPQPLFPPNSQLLSPPSPNPSRFVQSPLPTTICVSSPPPPSPQLRILPPAHPQPPPARTMAAFAQPNAKSPSGSRLQPPGSAPICRKGGGPC